MQQFIVITARNKPKNKVQALCQENLQGLDQTLYKSLNEARFVIENKFKQSLNEYKGPAVLPVLKSFKPKSETFQWYIEDVIYITVYAVKNRLE